jgi:hypothetical protein
MYISLSFSQDHQQLSVSLGIDPSGQARFIDLHIGPSISEDQEVLTRLTLGHLPHRDFTKLTPNGELSLPTSMI